MNHLAHAWLARHDDRAIVGAMLGDFVKGTLDATYPPEVRREIARHRRIDAFTDAHPAVREAVARFAPSLRRYAGIALDVHFDHLLARDWPRHAAAGPTLPEFTARVYRALGAFEQPLPPALATLAERLARHDGLAAYRDFATVEFALERLASRLSRGGEALRACAAELRREDAALADAFARLWPDLQAHAARWRDDPQDTRTSPSAPA